MQKYSVLMAVYIKDDPTWFALALDSVIHQTVSPDEIVIVKDGPITSDLQMVIDRQKNKDISVCEINLEKNMGRGEARRVGVLACHNEWIAIMDADDISVLNRCEMQLQYLQENPEIDVIGGQIEEFITDNEIIGKRVVPKYDAEIRKYMRKRNPINNVTVMYRKARILQVGNYHNWSFNEDYQLWIRLAELKEVRFANLEDTLVFVRVGSELYKRRGGIKYFYEYEFKIQKLMLDKGMIGYGQFCVNVIIRFVLQVLMPTWLRGIVFQKLARQKKEQIKLKESDD